MKASAVIVKLLFTIPTVTSYTKKTSRAEADETKVVEWLASDVGPRSRSFPPPDLQAVCAKVQVLDLNFDDDVKSALLARVLVELRWQDERLAFEHMMTNKTESSDRIKLDKVVLDPEHIWVPNLVFWSSNHVGSKNIRLSPGLTKAPLEILWDSQITWRQVRTEQFRCSDLASRGKGYWEPFNCTLELASWTMDKKRIKVEIVVDEDVYDGGEQEFGNGLGLDDSVGVSSWHPQCCKTPLKNEYGTHDCLRYSFVGQRRYRIEEANWNIRWNPIRDFNAEGGACTLATQASLLITALLVTLK